MAGHPIGCPATAAFTSWLATLDLRCLSAGEGLRGVSLLGPGDLHADLLPLVFGSDFQRRFLGTLDGLAVGIPAVGELGAPGPGTALRLEGFPDAGVPVIFGLAVFRMPALTFAVCLVLEMLV